MEFVIFDDFISERSCFHFRALSFSVWSKYYVESSHVIDDFDFEY